MSTSEAINFDIHTATDYDGGAWISNVWITMTDGSAFPLPPDDGKSGHWSLLNGLTAHVESVLAAQGTKLPRSLFPTVINGGRSIVLLDA